MKVRFILFTKYKNILNGLEVNISNINLLTVILKTLRYFIIYLLLPIGFCFAIIIRLISPWFLVRIEMLVSERMGHFAANTELYLCERLAGINVPKKPHFDLWFNNWPSSNNQLAMMWKQKLHVYPFWLLAPIAKANSLLPGSDEFRINTTQNDRDVFNLTDRFEEPSLYFSEKEEAKGKFFLKSMGIGDNDKFICLHVRDDNYLKKTIPWKVWDYHNHRNCNVNNYVLASLKLVELGYFVIRMGVKVSNPMQVTHPKIIDYAHNGMRSDFMDIYLGAKCHFCISTASGFDAIPFIFRRPIVYIDVIPVAYILTFNAKSITITKRHWSLEKERFLSLKEIMDSDLAYSLYASTYDHFNIKLLENTPETIAATVIEMENRLSGTWVENKDDQILQKRFWKIFLDSIEKRGYRHLHGNLRSHYGIDFLKNNPEFLQ